MGRTVGMPPQSTPRDTPDPDIQRVMNNIDRLRRIPLYSTLSCLLLHPGIIGPLLAVYSIVLRRAKLAVEEKWIPKRNPLDRLTEHR